MFDFPADMRSNRHLINRLNNQLLVQTFEREWALMSMPINRRQFLKGLGATLLLGAGLSALLRGQTRFQLKNLSPSHTLGHKLRDHRPFPAACKTVFKTRRHHWRWCSGLSSAWWLHRNGVSLNDIQLLELEAKVGGNARGGENTVRCVPLRRSLCPHTEPGIKMGPIIIEDLG